MRTSLRGGTDTAPPVVELVETTRETTAPPGSDEYAERPRHALDIERIHARRITATAPGVVAYSDGERLGPLPLDVECVPGALRVLV